MVRSWKKWKKQNPVKVKERVRKGIPDSLRGIVWPAFTGSALKKQAHPDVYKSLLSKEKSDHYATILKDLPRTYPRHIMFKSTNPDRADVGKGSYGQEVLCRVLDAYALQDPDVGYCQGIGFLAGIFLMYMEEEDAFWMLQCILRGNKYSLYGLYTKGFPLLDQYFYQLEQLQKDFCPKLYKMFAKKDETGMPLVLTSSYATQWFMTLFCKVSNTADIILPMEVQLRIWDIFLHEGIKIVFKVAIFILKYNEKKSFKMQR